jgi:alpha-tubulin suppressor-like RCC1 family protein
LGSSASCATTGSSMCLTAVPVFGPARFTQIAAASSRACAVSTQGAAYCWGRAAGSGSTQDLAVPTSIPVAQTWTQISAGAEFTCALAPDGHVWCWGQNTAGELGTGNMESTVLPVKISTPTI